MHGAGNDFVLIDHDHYVLPEDRQWYRMVADRHRGVGFDQLISYGLVDDDQLGYRIINSDGSAGGQCGNGARCVFRLLFDEGRIGESARLQSPSGVVSGTVHADGGVDVDMGEPRFSAAQIPFQPEPNDTDLLNVATGMERSSMGLVSMGNPHAVVQVSDSQSVDVAGIGARIQADPRFSDGVNVGFAEIVRRDHIRLRVYERGVGETLACGSGACAAAVVSIAKGVCDSQVRVSLPGGDLVIRWPKKGPVWMSGPTAYVFTGELS